MQMARFEFAYILAFTFALLFCRVDSAPVGRSVQSGQLGNATCNIERLQTVVGLEKSATSIQEAINATESNTVIVSQLKTAASGIESTQSGINMVLQALFSGQTDPANSRQRVGDGINVAAAALNSALANLCVFLLILFLHRRGQ